MISACHYNQQQTVGTEIFLQTKLIKEALDWRCLFAFKWSNHSRSLFVAWIWPLHAITLNETLSYTARSASLCLWLRLIMWHNNSSWSDAQRAPVAFYNSRCTYMSGFLLDNRLSAWLTINCRTNHILFDTDVHVVSDLFHQQCVMSL